MGWLRDDCSEVGYLLEQGYLEYPGDAVANWPFLIIQIEGVSKIEISDFEPIGGIQRAVSDIETEKIEEQYRTRLMDVYGGKIDFTHTQGFRLALFSADGERMEIKKPNEAVDSTSTRVTLPAGFASLRRGRKRATGRDR